MAYYAYNYHDSDPGGHKRQRIEPAGQHLWPASEVLTTDLTPRATYDPVRDILHDDTTFAGSSCFDFSSPSLNDSSFWHFEASSQFFPEPYSFEDQNALIASQPFCEQTAAAFATSFRDDLNESLANLPEDTTEGSVNELAHSSDVERSLPRGLPVICFGMVCPNPLIVLLQNLTCLNTDCRHPCSLQSIGVSACRIRVSATAISSTEFITSL